MFKKRSGLIALLLCIVLTVGYFVINTGAVSTVLLAIQGAITDGNLIKFSGTNGIGVDTGLSATNVVKCKFDATSAPTVNNDVDEGYTIGSRSWDVTNDKSYVCLDNTDGAAVWTETTGAGGGATTFTGLTDTPANYTGSSLKIIRVNVGETALEFVTLGGDGDMLKSTYDIDEDGDIDVAAGGTEKSSWTLYAIPYLSGTTTFGEIPIGTAGQILKVNTGATGYEFADEIGKNYYSALSSDHTYSDNADIDTQPVGESVVFGDLLYFNWADKEWKKAKADVEGTIPGTRIALESKVDGQTCLMLVKGYIRDDSAFDFAGAMVYVSEVTAGAMTSTAPSTAGNQLQRVGQAKSADILFFDPSPDVGEI